MTFRGTDKNGKHVFGYYFAKRERGEFPILHHYIVQDDETIEVENCSVKMCLELVDCNGTLLFEDDVIHGYEVRYEQKDGAVVPLIKVVNYSLYFENGMAWLRDLSNEEEDVPAFYMLDRELCPSDEYDKWGLGEGVEPKNLGEFPLVTPQLTYIYELKIEEEWKNQAKMQVVE